MTIIHGTTVEIETYFSNKKTYVENNTEYYDGFELMQPSFFKSLKLEQSPEKGCQYLVCLNETNEPIGMIKWKRYGIPNHEFVTEDEASDKESYVAIRFVDVKKDLRKQGIAKVLVRAFSEHLRNNDVVVGGKATPLGAEADIHSWIEREIKQTYYKNEIDLLNDWEQENKSW